MKDQKLWVGVLCALFAGLFISIMNFSAKILSDQIDPIVITFWRNLGALSLLILYFLITKKTHFIKTQKPIGQLIRAVLGTIGMVLSVWAYTLLPMTQAAVIGFTSPFFILMLSFPLLGEIVGKFRVFATAFGFSGVLVIIGFDTTESLNTLGIIVSICWAFFNALVLICLRWLGKTEHALTTVFYFMLIGLIMCALYLPFAPAIMPDETMYLWVGIIGFIGLLSLIFKTEAYRHAPTSVIAPIAYAILIWTTFLDFIVWDIVAGLNTWIGASIIITANLVIIWRESKKSNTNSNRMV
jgi:drug/metabolite transporter (DMT)-like permease